MKKLEIVLGTLFAFLVAWVLGRFASADPEIAEHSVLLAMGWSLLSLLILPSSRGHFFSKVATITLVILLCYGWLMVLNSKAFFDFMTLSFQEYQQRLWDGGPGTMTRNASIAKMIQITGLSMVFWAAVRWRRTNSWPFLLAVFPILGAAITMIGLYHRVLDAESIWFMDTRHPPTFFAPFVYNGHAGAYLNFAGAIGFGFWVSAMGHGKSAKTLGWGILTLMCFLGTLATASKGATLILAITVGLSFFLHRRKVLMVLRSIRENPRNLKFEGKLFLVTSAILFLVFGAVGVQKLIVRMDDFIEDAQDGRAATFEGRKQIISVMLGMSAIDEGGWFGFGPGSFATVVPFFLSVADDPPRGVWLHGHCDPVQLITEWGYLGASLWFTLAIGGLAVGLKTVRSKRKSSSRSLTSGIIVALISLGVHSCFDFPFGIVSLKLVAIVCCGFLWGAVKSGRSLHHGPSDI